MNIEILEEAAGIVAQNYFEIKHGNKDFEGNEKAFDEALSDVVFIINNFMRVSSNLAMTRESKEDTNG